jgi:hypothetical protein
LLKLHPAAEAIILKHETQVVNRTAKAQPVGAAKKRYAHLECRRKVSEQEERINPQPKFIQKDRIVKRHDVLTHRKLDEVIRDSFRLGAKDQALKFPVFVNRFKKFPSTVISEGESHVFRWSVA